MSDTLCRRCGWSGTDLLCPCCRTPVDASDRGRLAEDAPRGGDVVIARLPNAAEAGYFADELSQLLNCDPQVEFSDDFDAAGGSWRTQYTLSVPAALADRARDALRRLVDGDWTHEGDRSPETRHVERSGINWVPIMMTLAAGSFIIWCGKKLQPQVVAVEPEGALALDLLDTLAGGNGTWVQQNRNSGGSRELQVDRNGRGATLREDADGDGIFEQQYVIHCPR